MNVRIELRYAVLISLLLLLWLTVEYMVGLHDTYIPYHPFVTMLALIIPIVCIRLALKEKIDNQHGHLTFKQAFMSGVVIAIFSALFSIPVQLAFHTLINPDFFDNMIQYAVYRATTLNQNPIEAKLAAEITFNLKNYLLQSLFFTLVFGFILAIPMAYKFRTKK